MSIKKFAEGYWCASPYWKTCQLDCGDCSMLMPRIEIGIDGTCNICGILTKNYNDYGYICPKCEN